MKLALAVMGALVVSSVSNAADPAGNASGMSVRITGATASRFLKDKLGDHKSLLDFGAKCDGTTDDSAAITSAMASGKRISIPSGMICYGASISQGGITGSFSGPGQIKTSDGNLRGPIVNQITAAPAAGNFASVLSAFNGNVGKVPLAIEQRISGASTLGQPTSGYTITPEVSGILAFGYNASGWNNSLSNQHGGRTGAAVESLYVTQAGQGDYAGILCSGAAYTSKDGVTGESGWGYTAYPATICMNGGIVALTDRTNINLIGDMNLADNGHDVAAVGSLFNFNRTVATEYAGLNWVGDFRNSLGSLPVDAMYMANGGMVTGIDLSGANISYSKLSTVAISTTGTGYVVGDKLTVTGGTAVTPTMLSVSSINGDGGITGLTTINSGIYSAAPGNNYFTLSVSGGTGSGAVLMAAYSANNALLLPATGGCIAPGTTGNSAPTVRQPAYSGQLCMTQAGLTWGNSLSVTTTVGANVVVLGSGSQATGQNVHVRGYGGRDFSAYGADIWANGVFGAYGDAQTSQRMLRGASTGAAIRLTTNAQTVSGANSYFVPVGSAASVSLRVTIYDTTNGDSACWGCKTSLVGGLLSRAPGGNAAWNGQDATATAPDYYTGAGSTATVQISADTANQSLNVTVTPPAGTGHTWHAIARIEADQVF